MMNEVLWVEKYRPKTVRDCILPDELKNTFQKYVDNREIPHLLLAGTPGVGKTTIAKALCEEVDCDYLMLNGSDESGIDTFRMKVKNYASSISLGGGKKVIIIDEADYLNPNSTQPAMRGAMEEFAHNATFILTCNYKNRIIEPLQSRCATIDFRLKAEDKPKMARDFMHRAAGILKDEKIPFETPVLAEVVMKFFPDYRRILNELQRYAVSGKIDAGILSLVGDVEITELVAAMREKNFRDMRKWVAHHGYDDVSRIFRRIYDNLYDVMKKEDIPQAVIHIAKYQFQSAFVSDQELNLVACLTEIMSDCSFI